MVEHDLFLVSTWNSYRFRVVASRWTWKLSGDGHLLDFSERIYIYLAFMCGIEIGIILVWPSNLTRFLCGGQSWLRIYLRAVIFFGFHVCIEVYWFLFADRRWVVFSVRVHWLVLVWVVDTNLFFACGPEITRFWSERRRWLDNFLGAWNWLDSSVTMELDVNWVKVWNWFGCCVGCRSWHDFSLVIGIDSVFAWRSKRN